MKAKLDIDQLKRDMLNDCRGAYYGGGYGGAMYASFEIERAEGQELVDLAERMGYNLMPYIRETVTDEYSRKREVSLEEIRRALANADPGSITIREVTTDIYTGKQTVRNIPVSRDGSFDLYGNRMRFNTPSRSSYTPPPESKEERERRLKKEEEAKRKLNEMHAQAEKELEDVRRTAESRFGCRSKLKSFRTLEKQLPEKEKKLTQEEARLSAEQKTLERFLNGCCDENQKDLLRTKDISEQHRKLLLEKPQLLAQLETLGLFSFRAKKQIRSRIEQIDTEITDRMEKIDFLKREIMAARKENISRVEGAKHAFLKATDDALKYMCWREVFIQHFTDNRWNYERIVRPTFEYLESHSPCTVNDMYEQNPYKKDFSVNQIVSYFRLDFMKPFYRREMSGGRAYFYFVFPEDYQSRNPENWETEARKIREGK